VGACGTLCVPDSHPIFCKYISLGRGGGLFTTVSIKETMDLLGCHFEEDVLGLFHHVLTPSYFTFNGQFCGQMDGVAIGSPLSPVIANFYMEDFEKAALELAP
jgi:hypothetical protein